MALKKEVWEKELLKAFRGVPTFLNGVKDYTSKVLVGASGAATIHLTDVGGDPTVLVNNSSYPIASAQRNDSDVAISLDKMDTTNTDVTDDEIEALSYDKIKDVNEQHVAVLVQESHNLALHAFGPASDSADTPIVETTGADRGNFKKFTVNDLIALKKRFDDQDIPSGQRRIVLCPQHVADLLETSQAFKDQYSINEKTGSIGQLFGFDIHEWSKPVMYTAAGAKKAYGAAAVATDKQASIAFYIPRGFKAKTQPKRYYSKAEDNPLTRKSTMGYRMYFMAMPKTAKAIGAIIDAAA